MENVCAVVVTPYIYMLRPPFALATQTSTPGLHAETAGPCRFAAAHNIYGLVRASYLWFSGCTDASGWSDVVRGVSMPGTRGKLR